jgi:tryptophan 7-halogenase
VSVERLRSPLRYVVIGNEAVVALAAAALTQALDAAQHSVRVLAVPEPAVSVPVDSLLPLHSLPRIARLLDDDALISVAGSFSWGTAMTGWIAEGATSFRPFGSVGANFGPIAFHHLVQRLRREGVNLRLANHSLAALAAQAGRFARPERDPRSVTSTAEYGLHFDLAKMAQVLRVRAEQAGAVFESWSAGSVERNERGAITALIANDGRRVEGDFFVDCGELPAQLPDSWEDWSVWLHCDRMAVAAVPASAEPEPYSEARAFAGGWLRRVPVRGRAAFSAVYSSARIDDSAARGALRSLAGNDAIDPVVRAVRWGRLHGPWQGNCVALGSAAVRIDPVVVGNLQLACVGLEHLLQLLPASIDMHAEAIEFNRRFGAYADRSRDLTIAHYLLNGRRGESFWDAARAVPRPESLAYKLSLYEGRCQVALYDDEPVEQWGWLSLFDDAGLLPRHYNPLADGVPREQLAAHAQKARAFMLDAVAAMPLHGKYLAGLAGAHRERRS